MSNIPVSTSSVESPPDAPNAMSVFSRSPTIMVLAGSKLCLIGKHVVSTRGKRGGQHTHLARMQSSIVLFGFPMATGERPSAVASGATMAPAPGSKPVPNTLSAVKFRPEQAPCTSRCGVSAILVRSDKRAAWVARKVLECLAVLGVRDGHVQPADDRSHVWVKRE